MNIGIVTTWFERGAAYVSRAYVDTLSRRHDVFVYARGGERYARGNSRWDADYVTWGTPVAGRPETFVDFDEFCRWVQSRQLDVVIFNEQNSWDVVLRTLAELDVTIGSYVDYYTPATVPFFGLYDFLLCNTRRHHGVFENHPHAIYVPWGTDTSAFRPQDRPGKGQGITFFHSAGLSPGRKGTDILLRAFRGMSGDARLVIHSQGPITRHPEIAGLIAEDARVRVIEKEVGAPGLYHLGDVYVYPTRLEGIGLTIAEALACGLPVITTDSPPMNEFVDPNICGKLVEVERYRKRRDNYYWPESICGEESLASAMQFYVDNMESLSTHGRLAREYAVEHLDWLKNSEGLDRHIESVPRNRDRLDPALVKTVAAYDRRAEKLWRTRVRLQAFGSHRAKRLLGRVFDRYREA